MNALIKYIETHPEWQRELSEAPYNIVIKLDGPYMIFNYNQIKSDMSLPEVQAARGIILKITESERVLVNGGETQVKVVCHAFNKFFNYGEPNAHKIDWSTARVQEKVDGSIIKIWKDGEDWRFSTNGMIDAFNTDLQLPTSQFKSFGDLVYQGLLNTLGGLTGFSPEDTHIFELTSPWNRVVIPHRNITLTYLGSRNNKTGEEYQVTGHHFKVPKLYSFKSVDEILENIKTLPYDEEGYVVVDKDYNRVKIKSLAYLAIHHLKDNGNVNPRKILDLVKAGEQDEFLSYFPEYTDIFNEVKERWTSFLNAACNVISWTAEKRITGMSKKDFALQVKSSWMKPIFHSIAFAAWDDKDIQAMIYNLDYDRI